MDRESGDGDSGTEFAERVVEGDYHALKRALLELTRKEAEEKAETPDAEPPAIILEAPEGFSDEPATEKGDEGSGLLRF